MNRFITFLAGAQLGLGVMYLLDPNSGRRRRAQFRDKSGHFAREFQDGLRKSSRDLKHRSIGRFADIRAMLSREQVSDEVLHERVRAAIGRCTRHPSNIDVTVNDGLITLSGPVLASEVDEIIRGVTLVRGVTGVHSRLELHASADIPSLQGGERPRSRRGWTPATRLITGTAGTVLALDGLRRRRAEGVIIATAGGLLLVRSITNLPFADLIGLSRGRRRLVDFQKSLDIDAHIDEVFSVFSNFENWPRFMAHVRQVRDLGNGRSHWTYAGPAGLTVDWESELVGCVPNERLTWRSAPGSIVGHTGELRFERIGTRGTRVHTRLSYYPPGGALGHVVARLFGADPKRTMDEDLLRLKSLLEEGRTRLHGQRVEASAVDTGFDREGFERERFH